MKLTGSKDVTTLYTSGKNDVTIRYREVITMLITTIYSPGEIWRTFLASLFSRRYDGWWDFLDSSREPRSTPRFILLPTGSSSRFNNELISIFVLL
jgi:hypothetical protein